jgi:hypothetical protein
MLAIILSSTLWIWEIAYTSVLFGLISWGMAEMSNKFADVTCLSFGLETENPHYKICYEYCSPGSTLMFALK